jgi:hypothetical protein
MANKRTRIYERDRYKCHYCGISKDELYGKRAWFEFVDDLAQMAQLAEVFTHK